MHKRNGLRLSVKIGGWLTFLLLGLSLSYVPPVSASVPFLSFTSNSHILGFSPNSYYLSNGTYVLNATFIAANSVTPQSSLPSLPHEAAPQLNQVTYPNLWPGISLQYDQGKGILRSTYTLAAGADPDNIRIHYNASTQLNSDGSLSLKFAAGTLTEGRPIAWQEIGQKRVPVAVDFQLAEVDARSAEVGFHLGDYDSHYTLWIDPTLTWSTFLGGSGDDEGLAIALDNNNHVFVAGSSDASWGTPVRTYRGSIDAFVAELDAVSGNLLWSTFLGSTSIDKALDIATDGSGAVYVVGYSDASWHTPLRNHSGGYDAFVARLNGTTGILLWNTFLGGVGADRGWGLTVDNSGNAYITGSSTNSWARPVRPFAGSTDAFVAKLDANGTFDWNTFLGGNGFDRGLVAGVNNNGLVYISGVSSATWGSPVRPYTANDDVFAAQIDATTGTLAWNTFVGGSGIDESQTMFLDDNGRLYLSGFSDTNWGVPTRAYSGGYDAFAARVDTGGQLLWNTFLGASGDDFGYGIDMGSSNDIYIGGASSTTWGSPIRAYTSGNDAFIARVDMATGGLVWNTFMGGSGDEQGQDLTVDESSNIYAIGTATATWGSPVRSYTGAGDAFIVNVPPPCIHSASSGLWSSSSSWVGGIIPAATEGACILDGHTITLDISPQIAQLAVEEGGVLVIPLGFGLAAENFVYSDGTIEQTQVVNSATIPFVEISNAADTAVKYRGADVSSANNLGVVTVLVHELTDGEYCTSASTSSPPYARRCYEITVENDLPGGVRLWSLLSDLNDIAVANLSVYRRVQPNWVELTTNRTTGTDGGIYAYAAGDTPGFSNFLLGQQGLGPTAVTLNFLTIVPNSPAILFLLFLLLAALSLSTWPKYKKHLA